MSVTGAPIVNGAGTNNVVWANGTPEASPYTGGTSNRVRGGADGDDIMAKDINELRIWIEALSQHAHEYTDAVGGC